MKSCSVIGRSSEPDPRWYHAHAAAFTIARSSAIDGGLDFFLFSMNENMAMVDNWGSSIGSGDVWK